MEYFCLSRFLKKIKKNEKSHLRENPTANVLRNRTAAERISAPKHLGMESVDYRKFGRRNLGAKWAATTARAPRGLEKYSPQLCSQWTFHLCRCGFRTPWEHKKRLQPDKTTIAKNISSTLSCESCPFHPPPHPHTPPQLVLKQTTTGPAL